MSTKKTVRVDYLDEEGTEGRKVGRVPDGPVAGADIIKVLGIKHPEVRYFHTLPSGCIAMFVIEDGDGYVYTGVARQVGRSGREG